MDDLIVRASTCTRCDLSLTRQRVVVGSGSYDAALVIVGEAPGKSEDESGLPFVGRSGQLLFSLIEDETGLTRDECFVTSVVKCRPPGNRTPKRAEIVACSLWWEQQVERFGTAVVVTLGNTALRAVLQSTSNIGALHGQVTQCGALTVVSTYHPAAALRGVPNVMSMMRSDLRIVASLLSERQS
jgi:uracil-DNA glycosylase family 4